ncbi:YccS family putative transporter [Polaromonas sp.]|uniref:YccS family putative transporter n=1 Tax=Polaromonas sp. TaxID=1869339 RepID=UPI003C859C3A
MMDEWRGVWRSALKREAFSRGMRVLLALASVVFGGWWLNQMQAVIPLLLGVIAGALAESDDSWRGQIRAQFTTLLCFAVMALMVQASLPYPGLLAVVLGLAAFGLTLLGALGERYRALAIATLILAIYTALAAAPPSSPSGQPMAQWPVAWLLAGAAWYGLVSVLWAAALPMLPVRQNMAGLYEVLGTYLRLKARLFEPVRGIDVEHRRLALALHNGRVVEALNLVKESLFIRTEPGRTPAWLGEALQLYFVAQDVHERITSSHEHYDVLANAFFHSDVLYRCQRVVALLGQDCLMLAQAVEPQGGVLGGGATARALEDLAAAIRHVEVQEARPAAGPLRALHALAANLEELHRVLGSALAPLPDRLPADASLLDRSPRSARDAWQRVRAQWSLASPLMRHALRMSVALVAGYAVMLATNDSYGFWILLTIVFVCQPQYGATLTRLLQRIWGTVLGLVVGWALLRLFPDVLVQSAFTVAAGALFFVTRHTRYTLATAAVTSLVLLSFNQVGDGFGLIVPRLLDTLAGSLISGLAVWLVLPSWHSRRLHSMAAQAMRTQALYLSEIMVQYRAGKQDHLAYRLARRNAHNAEAALSSAMDAVFQEPVYVRRHAGAGTRFLVLSHTLLNYLSALGAHRKLQQEPDHDSAAARAAACLLDGLGMLAAALETGRALPVSATPEESALLDALSRPVDAAGAQHQLRSPLLLLALRLLPQLREQAAGLVPAAAGGAAGGDTGRLARA